MSGRAKRDHVKQKIQFSYVTFYRFCLSQPPSTQLIHFAASTYSSNWLWASQSSCSVQTSVLGSPYLQCNQSPQIIPLLEMLLVMYIGHIALNAFQDGHNNYLVSILRGTFATGSWLLTSHLLERWLAPSLVMVYPPILTLGAKEATFYHWSIKVISSTFTVNTFLRLQKETAALPGCFGDSTGYILLARHVLPLSSNPMPQEWMHRVGWKLRQYWPSKYYIFSIWQAAGKTMRSYESPHSAYLHIYHMQ